MPSEFIKSSINDRILTIEFNRREKKNALLSEMYQTLAELLVKADQDPSISVVNIQGTKDLFTSGNDVKDFLQRDTTKIPDAIHFLKAISSFSKPIIATVGGDAIGIGTTLLLHCDLVVASDTARFQLPFASLGLCPEAASSFLLQQVAGSKLANQLLMLGDYFDANLAKDAGIVNFIVSEDGLLEHGKLIARKLALQPADALRTTKKLLKIHHAEVVKKVMDNELQEFSRLLSTPASREIFSAFLEKRPPNRKIIEAA